MEECPTYAKMLPTTWLNALCAKFHAHSVGLNTKLQNCDPDAGTSKQGRYQQVLWLYWGSLQPKKNTGTWPAKEATVGGLPPQRRATSCSEGCWRTRASMCRAAIR